MEDTVTFGLPGHSDAISLREALAASRLCVVDYRDSGWLVRAGFGPEPEDFAALLRAVQAWMSEGGFRALRFGVDGRSYVLASEAVAVPAAA